MKRLALSSARLLVTLVAVAVAAVLIWQMVSYYLFAPWTRDGHIRVDVIQVAPDVSGLIARVEVHDNQPVSRGQVLFVIDQARFQVALKQAEALRDDRRETLAQARREAARNRALGKLVAREIVEESESTVLRAGAALAEAEAAVGTARLNLERTVISSPVDGYLNDRAPRVGEFVSAGRNVLSVVDKDSFHLDGYFEETKLGHIHVGQAVDIRVMGDERRLTGHVQSIAAAIEDRDRTSGANLLPNVNPAFSWVRLAQRVPVRILFDEVPEDFRMVAGRTATVSIIEDGQKP
ncbi:efflux RND transporter periplasmic adaptor subunit [Pseudomonas sp. Gutcm_11s]|uniref:efflux RND transporter periplasmic adaptor subunit n=1 Tax=Pseudomonas sp. Gutcm_11s TaxID=3026088 RepID=UPI0023627CD2|nr:HlyD family secretion protein [Pseudomonas sp. Gutcm_11s]MDD0841344.1 HlyD family secretion protein [Pseudomonas sp. Gutcm_11s]